MIASKLHALHVALTSIVRSVVSTAMLGGHGRTLLPEALRRWREQRWRNGLHTLRALLLIIHLILHDR